LSADDLRQVPVVWFEPGELSQWLCHDDSTINIVVCDVYVGGKVRVSEFMIFLALQQ